MSDELGLLLLGWVLGVMTGIVIALIAGTQEKKHDHDAFRFVQRVNPPTSRAPWEVHPPGNAAPAPPRIATDDPSRSVAPSSVPAIVTRTGPSSGMPLVDRFAVDGERRWTATEQQKAVKMYRDGRTLESIARTMRIDMKDVAALLVRVLLGATGVIADEANAPRSRAAYLPAELRRIRESCEASVGLGQLAKELGRSQLGVGWRMLDMRVCPPTGCRTHHAR